MAKPKKGVVPAALRKFVKTKKQLAVMGKGASKARKGKKKS
jgi:hypothetical protein